MTRELIAIVTVGVALAGVILFWTQRPWTGTVSAALRRTLTAAGIEASRRHHRRRAPHLIGKV